MTEVTQHYKDIVVSEMARIKVQLAVKVMRIDCHHHKKHWWSKQLITDGNVTLRIGLMNGKDDFLVIFGDVVLSEDSWLKILSDSISVKLEDFIQLL